MKYETIPPMMLPIAIASNINVVFCPDKSNADDVISVGKGTMAPNTLLRKRLRIPYLIKIGFSIIGCTRSINTICHLLLLD